jgi:hypothetical protein
MPLSSDPAFAPDAHDMRAEHEVLNEKIRITLEARTGRERPDLDDALLMNSAIGACHHLAPTPFAGCPRPELTGFVHAARLEPWPTLEPLEAGNLVPLCRDRVLQLRHFAHKLSHETLQLGTG